MTIPASGIPASPSPVIQLATASNEAYAPALKVAVASALAALHPDAQALLHVLDGGLTAHTLRWLQHAVPLLHPRAQVQVHRVDEHSFRHATPMRNGSFMPYVRLLLGSIVPDDRIIYFDADMVIQRDLQDAWHLDLQGHTIAACLNRGAMTLGSDCPWPLADDEKAIPYFNSGFLIIDLARWRQESREAEAFHLAPTGKCRFFDQTIMNYMFRHHRLLLDQAWNWQEEHLAPDRALSEVNLHFIERRKKPWLYHGAAARFQVWRFYYGLFAGNLTALFLSRPALHTWREQNKERLFRLAPVQRIYRYLLIRAGRDPGPATVTKVHPPVDPARLTNERLQVQALRKGFSFRPACFILRMAGRPRFRRRHP